MKPEKEEIIKRPSGLGQRHLLAILSSIGFAISYGMRFNLSLAIVVMVKRSHHGTKVVNGSIQEEILSCPNFNSSLPVIEEDEGEFEWSEYEQGIILGSFFWGYCITQLPGGLLAKKFGGKWTIGLGLLIPGIFTLLTPLAARLHIYCLIAVRIILGIGEGVTFPAMHAMFSYWAPPDERSSLVSISYGGAQAGTAITMVISGLLIDAKVWGGWPSVFYIIGIACIIWFVLWSFLIFDTPKSHPRISEEEKIYIEKSIGDQISKDKVKIPWSKFATSVPFWAIIVGHIGHNWGLYVLLTGLPTYMKTVLNFDIKQNGYLSAFPYLLNWIMSVILTQFADFLITKKILKVITVRKSFQAFAHITSAIALIAASYTGCDRIWTIILITTAIAINGGAYAGFVVNHMDLSANFAGLLLGITNTIGNFCGFLAPAVTGYLINQNSNVGQWQIVFFIASSIYVADVIFYTLSASATEQSWNRSKSKEKNEMFTIM